MESNDDTDDIYWWISALVKNKTKKCKTILDLATLVGGTEEAESQSEEQECSGQFVLP